MAYSGDRSAGILGADNEVHISGRAMTPKQDSDIGIVPTIGTSAHAPGSKYERLVARAKGVPAAKTIVVHPCDETSLRGAVEAAETGIIVPTLIGPRA